MHVVLLCFNFQYKKALKSSVRLLRLHYYILGLSNSLRGVRSNAPVADMPISKTHLFNIYLFASDHVLTKQNVNRLWIEPNERGLPLSSLVVRLNIFLDYSVQTREKLSLSFEVGYNNATLCT